MKNQKLSLDDFKKNQILSVQKATINGGWPVPAPGSDPITIGPPPVKPAPGTDDYDPLFDYDTY